MNNFRFTFRMPPYVADARTRMNKLADDEFTLWLVADELSQHRSIVFGNRRLLAVGFI